MINSNNLYEMDPDEVNKALHGRNELKQKLLLLRQQLIRRTIAEETAEETEAGVSGGCTEKYIVLRKITRAQQMHYN